MSDSQVAVIITCYNLGRTLDEAVTSVRCQTLQATELLIVDDGSTDLFTQEVLVRLEAEGVSVCRTPNRGVSAARNLGIRKTGAPLIVLLDADDVLELTYLQKAAARLEHEQSLSFVSCGMRSFGAADEVWFPPNPSLIESLTAGVVHISSMFRRGMWEAVGGFDEEMRGHEDVDFWTAVNARGFLGEVIPEPLLRYRVRAGSNSLSAIRRADHQRLMDHFYQKHAATLGGHVESLLLAKERFLVEQKKHQERLQQRKGELEGESQALQAEVEEVVARLHARGRGRIEFGDLRRLTPISPVWGLDRGIPLDRYYIHSFLERHRADVRGHVLEVKDPGYTHAFGDTRVTKSDVLDLDSSNDLATIVADLSRADVLPDNQYDCFILTQTLGVIFDVAGALQHAYRILAPGGVLLCTLPATGRISYEEGLDGDYWRFTDASVRTLFAGTFPLDAFEITSHGNVLAAAAFLYGLTPGELTKAELDAADPYFPVVYTVRAVKPPSIEVSGGPAPQQASRRRDPARSRGAVLMYHRVADQQTDPHHLCVPPDEFRGHMAHLRDGGYQVIPLHELVEAATTRTLDARAVSLTFDDGYLDALTDAAPILLDYQFPATFFVVGAALDDMHEFWWDALDRIFFSGRVLPEIVDLSLPGGVLALPTANAGQQRAAHDRIVDAFYSLGRKERAAAIAHLATWSGVESPSTTDRRPMTAKEVVALARLPGMSIGAHSEHHQLLPTLGSDEKRAEIEGGKRRLESVIGRRVTSFSYPYGAWDVEAVGLVRQAGFDVAVTTEERIVDSTVDRYMVPRVEVRGGGGTRAFAGRLEVLR